ncbi:MAG: NADH-quinone oxidoreductase subunit NuoG, partial [Deltaproteobacteria bacterium]
MVTVKINGKEITVADNTLILEAARDAGHEVPTFCYQADLMGLGSCRMCLVEIEGQKKLQPSCITPVLHGMSILTDSATVTAARAGVLEFLLANHAMDCPVCDKAGECELQDMVYKYGPAKGAHAETKFKFHEKDYALSPVIIKNSNRCVQCTKCVRVCREVVGVGVLGSVGRGDHQEETSFLKSLLDCDQDGNCIEVCPVGCFMRLPYRYKTRPWDLKSADTVCPYCATGCRMVIEERDGVVVRARAQHGVGVNSETLCSRGRFGFDFIGNSERLATPLVRKDGVLVPCTWEDAIAIIKENLSAFAGPRIGGVASPRLTNEELYLFQKLFREILGSPNVDSSARWDSSGVEAFIKATGMNEGGVSVFDCMDSDTVLVIGSQVSEENPVTDYIIRRISSGRRMNLIIASPRAMKLDSSAQTSIRHNPAAEGALLKAIILTLNENNLSLSAALNAIKETKLKECAASSGVSLEAIKRIADGLKNAQSISILAGTEFLRFPEGIEGLDLLKDVLVKSLGKKLRILPLLDRCNQRGAWEMGVHPGFGPGYRAIAGRGMGTHAQLQAAEKRNLDAMYVAGVDIASMYPDAEHARVALAALKFLVVQDMFLTDTGRLANVVLPSAAFAEKDGAFTNQEGRVQTIRRLKNPPGKAKRDLDIIRAIGESFDRSFGPKNASLVFDEIRQQAHMYKDVDLAFNNKRNIDNKLDNKEALVGGSSAPAHGFSAWRGGASPSEETDAYPFTLMTGNHLFHSGALSSNSASLSGLLRAAVVEISHEDADEMGVKSGSIVRVKGRVYESDMKVIIRRGSKKGVVFIAENFPDTPVNRFFSRGRAGAMVSITRLG